MAQSATMHQADPREMVLNAPMSRFQVRVVGIAIVLCALDGFDVLAVTYAAPGFLAEWQLSKAELGFALAMGLVGMALGSLAMAPVADSLGRRCIVLACLAVIGVSMAATAYTGSFRELSAWRLITGLGIGTMLSVLNPLTAEYSNARRRDLAVCLMAIGFPVGGMLGGAAAALLLHMYDWRAIFLFGGGLSLVMIPVVLYCILEPVGFLIERPTDRSLDLVNRFLSRCGLPTVDRLPPPSPQRERLPFKELFQGGNLSTTVHLAAIFGAYMVAVYFFLSWTPQMVTDLGFSPSLAAASTVTRDLAGILAGTLIGWLAYYLGLKQVTLVVMAVMIPALVMLGQVGPNLLQLQLVNALGGFCLYSGMVGLMAIVPRTFPNRTRASGAGFVIGVGRIAAAVAPLLAGYLFTYGLERPHVTFVMSLFALSSVVLLSCFRVKPVSAF